MALSGGIFLANMGGGGCRSCFARCRNGLRRPSGEECRCRLRLRLPDAFSFLLSVCYPRFTILATSYRSAEAPSRQKCRKSASESAGPKRGAKESAEKVLRASSLCRSTYSALSSAPRLRPALFEALFRHFCRDGASALL